MRTKKLLYAFLKEVEKSKGKGFTLTNQDFGISEEEYYDIIRLAHREGFIINVFYADNIPYDYSLIELTMKGIEFIEQNSGWAKLYNGLKEIRDWIK
ncbi:MAG: hypothetical protein GX263_09730 [Firmicutes bacterium]|nr:hypothetical protein [Bacillota bacterium]